MNRRYTRQNRVQVVGFPIHNGYLIKKCIVYLFLCGVIFLISLTAKAQDPTFTQFYQNPIYYNPALAGISDGLVIRTNYRNFWRKMNSGFNIADVTIDSEESFLNGGISFIAMNGIEGNGIIISQLIGLAYSYNLPIIPRRIELQMGLQGAYAHKSIRTENLIFSDQLDAIYGITGSSNYSSAQGDGVSYPDFATGFNLRFNAGKIRGGTAATTILTGFAMHHITRPNESLSGLKSRLPIKYVGYSSAIIKIENLYSKKTF
ncbi:MAG: PorP/SprF family type IX secretion system membrane protein, partial [Bacteroidales bacterium]|nr:PorP/SprF family type IX secretion system membrane protein [Bacteroidales bacterium]